MRISEMVDDIESQAALKRQLLDLPAKGPSLAHSLAHSLALHSLALIGTHWRSRHGLGAGRPSASVCSAFWTCGKLR
jgi:hypothetical protein